MKVCLRDAKRNLIIALQASEPATGSPQSVFNNISGSLECCQRSGGETTSCVAHLASPQPPARHSAHSLSPLTVALNYTQMETA